MCVYLFFFLANIMGEHTGRVKQYSTSCRFRRGREASCLFLSRGKRFVMRPIFACTFRKERVRQGLNLLGSGIHPNPLPPSLIRVYTLTDCIQKITPSSEESFWFLRVPTISSSIRPDWLTGLVRGWQLILSKIQPHLITLEEILSRFTTLKTGAKCEHKWN